MEDRRCPISQTARILGSKWTLELLYYLRERRRFCELPELVGGVNPATLSDRLKMLERAGLVRRHVISEGPPHVEYDLTEKGQDLSAVLDQLVAWARRWA